MIGTRSLSLLDSLYVASAVLFHVAFLSSLFAYLCRHSKHLEGGQTIYLCPDLWITNQWPPLLNKTGHRGSLGAINENNRDINRCIRQCDVNYVRALLFLYGDASPYIHTCNYGEQYWREGRNEHQRIIGIPCFRIILLDVKSHNSCFHSTPLTIVSTSKRPWRTRVRCRSTLWQCYPPRALIRTLHYRRLRITVKQKVFP